MHALRKHKLPLGCRCCTYLSSWNVVLGGVVVLLVSHLPAGIERGKVDEGCLFVPFCF